MNSHRSLAQRPSTQRKMKDILKAARSEFFANGFAAASIESIAAKAYVSKVTIYKYYNSKENLFGEMLQAEVAHMRDNFQISKLQQKSLRDILTAAGMDMLGFLTQKKMIRFERMMGAEVNRDPRLGDFFLDQGPRSLLNSLTELLEAAVARGEIRSEDIHYSAEMFPSLVMGRMDMMMRYGWKPDLSEKNRKQRVEQAVSAWMKIHEK